eukprot:CAMPEP_0185578210 /NCGR_PEP_ID=MMETSP0434-20130131/12307_1 /TAXON_ID=626734 ORGANISM="Favella taraikaensis, Strain Fe Narragansett Bay" /NCGR_SAMPLE_ID=MMETSP0434 /ASSEMBLY_ACC=CAM_ASM_000379 /LENGTH=258 /DNA_ID=CAMNT_0028195965 /DNA_START=14 /DNA_END=790 /DNA_ORIENTATION=+
MNSPAFVVGKMVQRLSYNLGRVQKEAGLQLDRMGSQFTQDIAYLQESSRHRQRMPLYDTIPQVADAWVAPNATLVGEVIVSKWATIWYNVTIRAELNAVRIGNFTSVGDGTSIYSSHSLPHGLASSVNIGKNVTIGASCSIHSCIIDDDCVIGSGSVIGAGARVERGAVILPNTVVPVGRLIPAGQVWGGNPCTFVRELSQKELNDNYMASYANGSAESTSADAFSLYPRDYVNDSVPAGEDSMEQYAEKKFFANMKQ